MAVQASPTSPGPKFIFFWQVELIKEILIGSCGKKMTPNLMKTVSVNQILISKITDGSIKSCVGSLSLSLSLSLTPKSLSSIQNVVKVVPVFQ